MRKKQRHTTTRVRRKTQRRIRIEASHHKPHHHRTHHARKHEENGLLDTTEKLIDQASELFKTGLRGSLALTEAGHRLLKRKANETVDLTSSSIQKVVRKGTQGLKRGIHKI